MNWAKRVYCNRCGIQRPHLSKIKNKSYMLSKLQEENTWCCSVCKNINHNDKTHCSVCSNPRPDDLPMVESKEGIQRPEISYD